MHTTHCVFLRLFNLYRALCFFPAIYPNPGQCNETPFFKKIKRNKGFSKHIHFSRRGRVACVCHAPPTETKLVSFFLYLLPTNLDLPRPAQNTLVKKPKGAARGAHTPLLKWRVGGLRSTVAFAVSQSM